MKRIGIISDTHAYWDEKYLHYFEPCDEIWHAGDIGSLEVAQKLAEFRPYMEILTVVTCAVSSPRPSDGNARMWMF